METVRTVKQEDVDEITAIYNHYILNSIITFEEAPVTIKEMSRRIESINAGLPWIVYENNRQIFGYAYASRWKSRSAYIRSVESTVYLKHGQSKKGVGSQLYSELIKRLTMMGIHAVIGGKSSFSIAPIGAGESPQTCSEPSRATTFCNKKICSWFSWNWSILNCQPTKM